MSSRILPVSEVRQVIHQNARPGTSAAGEPSTAELGRWFHESFARIVGSDPQLGWGTVASEVGSDANALARQLTARVYRHIVCPRISDPKTRNNITGNGPLLNYWHATEELCRWLGGIFEQVSRQRLALEAVAEEALSWTFREPVGYTEITVIGRADAVFRNPQNGRWCVVELKLGRQSPEADLAQACLYYQMLQESTGQSDPGSLVLASFKPHLETRSFSAAALEPVLSLLQRLIFEMVYPDGPRPPPPEPPPPPDPTRLAQLRHEIEKVSEEHGAAVTVEGEPSIGPAFVRFALAPKRGVRLRRVVGLAQEIQVRLHLAAPPFIDIRNGRLVADVQRPDRQTVHFHEVEDQFSKPDAAGSSRIPIGVDLNWRLEFADLAKPENSHILVAGTSGSGKSEWLRTAMAGLIVSNTPDTLRFVLIDPKRNAFPEMKHSPYLLNPEALVFPDDQDVNESLDLLIEEMEARYRRMEAEQADDFVDLIKRTGEPLPRIVCVCDEYRDLVLREAKQRKAFEQRIDRLGAKARAAGIHLILATQTPSRSVVTGPIHANMSCRVGLLLKNGIESRMVIGDNGSENLLGQGDLLFVDIGQPRRFQGLLMSREDRERLLGHQGFA